MSGYPVLTDRDRGLSWSAIFGGTFVFLAIEVTFGILGMAVFASAISPATENAATSGLTVGIGIWAVVLSVIALFFGGRSAALLSRTSNSHIGMCHGLVTFGMAIFSSILITSTALSGTFSGKESPGSLGTTRVVDVLAVGGYWLFAVLILGLIAATVGGRSGVARRAPREATRPEVVEPRKAA